MRWTSHEYAVSIEYVLHFATCEQPMRRVEMCVYRMLYSLLKDMRLLTVLKAALARPEHSIS